MPVIDFAVPLPAAGANAILTFEFADLEKLQAKIGPGYANKIAAGLNADDPAIIRDTLAIGVKGGDPEAALNGMPLDAIKAAVMDALTLRLAGKTADA